MTDSTLSIKIKTLTPLWTGGVDGTMDRIHETGIIGSLRWWYEAIVRGLGGSACDPTGENQCRYDPRDSRPPEEQLCPACYVFGATGWKRRFRVEVLEDKTKSIWKPRNKNLNIRPPGRHRGWYLPPGRMGQLTLRFSGEASTISMLASLLLFLEKWGCLGAKTQLGYGIFEITNQIEVRSWAKGDGKTKPGWSWQSMNRQSHRCLPFPGEKAKHISCPDLSEFGFFRYRFQTSGSSWLDDVQNSLQKHAPVSVKNLHHQFGIVPLLPVLKDKWRFHEWRDQKSEGEIFGMLSRKQRIRSKVAASWAYNVGASEWEIRGWIWLAKKKWSDRAWHIITNKDIWENALKIQGADKSYLEIKRLSNPEDVETFLASASQGGSDET